MDASEDKGVLAMRAELARKIAERTVEEGDTATEIAGLRLYRRSVPSACASATYEPSLVVFAQGKSASTLAKRRTCAMVPIFC